MRLKWRSRALKNFLAIHSHISQHNPHAADRIGIEIQAAAMRLKQSPYLGHIGERVGIRELQVPGRPHLLPYRVEGEIIEILAVFDQRRNPEDRF